MSELLPHVVCCYKMLCFVWSFKNTADGHSTTPIHGKGRGHLTSALLCLGTESTHAIAAQRSLARTSQISISSCKGPGYVVLYMPEKRGEQDIDEH